MPPFNKHWNWFQVLQDFRIVEKGNLHLSLHMKKNLDFATKLKQKERPHTPLRLPAFQLGIKVLE